MVTLSEKELPFRMSFGNRVKAGFWKYFAQWFVPHARDLLIWAKIIRHHGRQPYVLGNLAPGRTAEELRDHLLSKHRFEDHFPCWKDDGEVVDLRIRKNFEYQYHIRIFSDGEVRGHYEFTPECKPLKHITDRGMENRREEFLAFTGHMLISS